MKRLGLVCRAAALAIAAGVAGCSSGETATVGLDEPVRLTGGQFHTGDVSVGATGPTVGNVDTLQRILLPGLTNKSFSGFVSNTASSIALRLEGLGSGYWTIPTGSPDTQHPGQLTWAATVSLSYDVPIGFHNLLFYGIDAEGQAGPPLPLEVCVDSSIPDNQHACDPTNPANALPAAVLSLSWDTPVDLDIRLVTPSGTTVGSKQYATVPIDGGITAAAAAKVPGLGILDRDSNVGCVDGPRRENVVWQTSFTPGLYYLYANLFDACGQASVRFRADLYVPSPTADGGTAFVSQLLGAGELLKIDANGGTGPGLFVTEFIMQ